LTFISKVLGEEKSLAAHTLCKCKMKFKAEIGALAALFTETVVQTHFL
jgi:hypothetical protein